MSEASVQSSGEKPVTVVAGVTGGVGRAVADVFESHRLVLLGRDPDKLRPIETAFPAARSVAVDFGSVGSIESAFEGLPGIDQLIICTGAIVASRIGSADIEDWRMMMEANVLVPLAVVRAALPLLRSSHGSIVFLSSGSARRVRPEWSGYSASKYALKALAEGLELEEPDLRILSIYAGAIDTPLRQRLGEAKGRDYQDGDYLTPEEVAQSVAFALQMRSRVSVGEIALRVAPGRKGHADLG